MFEARQAAQLTPLQRLTSAYQETDDGLEKRCTRCAEYWPADDEFFCLDAKAYDGLTARCKACYAEIRASSTPKNTTLKGCDTMNEVNEKKLLDYLSKQTTPRRVVQICDALDLEVDDVEALVSMLTRSGQVVKTQAEAPNRLMANAYSFNPAHPANTAPDTGADEPSVGHTTPDTSNSAPDVVVAKPAGPSRIAVIAAAAQTKGRITKVDLALAHLREFGASDSTGMATAMNIPSCSSVPAYLKEPLKDGRIIRIENTYSLPPAESSAPTQLNAPAGTPNALVQPVVEDPAQPPAPPAALPLVDAPAQPVAPQVAPVDLDVIALLRDRLSPAEFGGYLKANVIALTLWPQNGAADYRRAGVFVDLLADHAVETVFA